MLLTSEIPNIVAEAWQEILARPHGPLAFRFYIQPAMAMFFAVRDGLRDARTGEPPYFWSLFTRPGHRKDWLRSGWRSIGKIIVLAFVLDTVYEIVVFHGLRPVQSIFVALELAVVPYLLLRGPVTRLARRRARPASRASTRNTR